VGHNTSTSKFVHYWSEKIQKKARKSQVSSGFFIFEIKPDTLKRARKSQSSSVFFFFLNKTCWKTDVEKQIFTSNMLKNRFSHLASKKPICHPCYSVCTTVNCTSATSYSCDATTTFFLNWITVNNKWLNNYKHFLFRYLHSTSSTTNWPTCSLNAARWSKMSWCVNILEQKIISLENEEPSWVPWNSQNSATCFWEPSAGFRGVKGPHNVV